MEQTPDEKEFRERFHAKCLCVCERIARLIEIDAPDLVVANEIAVLVWASASMGVHVWQQIGEIGQDWARLRVGRCPDCGGDLGDHRRDMPMCSKCVAFNASEDFEDAMRDEDNTSEQGPHLGK